MVVTIKVESYENWPLVPNISRNRTNESASDILMEFVSARNALIKRNVDGLKESLSQRTGQDHLNFFKVAEIIVIKKIG